MYANQHTFAKIDFRLLRGIKVNNNKQTFISKKPSFSVVPNNRQSRGI